MKQFDTTTTKPFRKFYIKCSQLKVIWKGKNSGNHSTLQKCTISTTTYKNLIPKKDLKLL